jgi:hypothetical protein
MRPARSAAPLSPQGPIGLAKRYMMLRLMRSRAGMRGWRIFSRFLEDFPPTAIQTDVIF